MKTILSLRNVVIIALLISSLVACKSSGYVTVDEVLQQMKINQDTLSKMSVCEQIRIYADVGSRFLDIDHMTVLMPTWFDDIIDNEPKSVVGNCLAEEGIYRLNLLAGQPTFKRDVSFSIHALVYKANNLKILDNPEIQILLNHAICESNLDYQFELVLIDYVNRFKNPPQYLNQNGGTEKMQAELCK